MSQITTIPAPFVGKTALVTGASRGLGAAIAVNFASRGIQKIAITYASAQAKADEVLSELRKINPKIVAVAIKCDVLSPTCAEDLIPEVLRSLETSTIDIIVNNATTTNVKIDPIATITRQAFDEFFTANTWSPLQIFLKALPHIPRGGRVINISSLASRDANEDPLLPYGASKAAQDSLTRGLANIYSAKHLITINSVSVGATATDALNAAKDAGMLDFINASAARATAEKRIGEPSDVADIVGFLASPDARWINGNHIPANGGCVLNLQG